MIGIYAIKLSYYWYIRPGVAVNDEQDPKLPGNFPGNLPAILLQCGQPPVKHWQADKQPVNFRVNCVCDYNIFYC